MHEKQPDILDKQLFAEHIRVKINTEGNPKRVF